MRDRLSKLFGDLSDLVVEDIKRDTLDIAEQGASAFTTIFIVAGLFGITAGLVLIFLIFVMLAAERKSEMGMARAVGAQRGRLVEMFVFEGTAYDLAAATVGVALGVVAGLIIALTLGQAFAGVGLDIRPSISLLVRQLFDHRRGMNLFQGHATCVVLFMTGDVNGTAEIRIEEKWRGRCCCRCCCGCWRCRCRC